jgi:hypothetical protein
MAELTHEQLWKVCLRKPHGSCAEHDHIDSKSPADGGLRITGTQSD